jgi:hypothetical protein
MSPSTHHSATSDQTLPPDTDTVSSWQAWLSQPLSTRWCAVGWFAAVALFMGFVRIFGGPSTNDANESFYSTWAIAHGRFSCAYFPPTKLHFYPLFQPGPSIPPLWPLVSGGFSALLQIGHQVPFPSQGALGPHCSQATYAMYQWAGAIRVTLPTVGLGYLSWLVLIAGTVSLLRAVGRGLCRWEPVTLIVLACLPIVWTPLLDDFHPQDFVAMGLVLGALACVRRDWWVLAGAGLGLAFTSQQFALLVVAPLIVLVPAHRRLRFMGAAIAVTVVIIGPMIAVTAGRAFRSVLLGSGNTPSIGGTVLRELHPHGAPLVVLSRILPILLAAVLAGWARQRLGEHSLDPVPLISLMATSFSLRLVFEQNLFGYYFMALAVSLVVLDVTRGQVRGTVVAWLALVTLVFNPVPYGTSVNAESWGLQVTAAFRIAFMAAALLLIVIDVTQGRIHWYRVAWLVLTAAVFARWPPWVDLPLRHNLPIWFWQVVLVTSGAFLAAAPLLARTAGTASSTEPAASDQLRVRQNVDSDGKGM